jgi:hypothetical protein
MMIFVSHMLNTSLVCLKCGHHSLSDLEISIYYQVFKTNTMYLLEFDIF